MLRWRCARWRSGALARLEGITGTLSAESLNGPFKFAGRAAVGDQRATCSSHVGRMSADGLMPVKATSRVKGWSIAPRATSRTCPRAIIRRRGDGERAACAWSAPAQAPPWRAQANGPGHAGRGRIRAISAWRSRAAAPADVHRHGQADLGRRPAAGWRAWTRSGSISTCWPAKLEAGSQRRCCWNCPHSLAMCLCRRGARVSTMRSGRSASAAISSRCSCGRAARRRGLGRREAGGGAAGRQRFGFEGAFTSEEVRRSSRATVRTSGSNLGRLLRWGCPIMVERPMRRQRRFPCRRRWNRATLRSP